MRRDYGPGAYLGVAADPRSGLYHGTLHANRPTPSGLDRWMLQVSTTNGYATAREAAEAMNAAFPDLIQVDVEEVAAGDNLLDGLVLPKGATLTRLKPQRGDDEMEKGVAPVEVTIGRKVLDIQVSVEQFERLRMLGHIVFESTSGYDPNLYYHYDHYVQVAGRGTKTAPTRARRAA